jgi:hypothetical protein
VTHADKSRKISCPGIIALIAVVCGSAVAGDLAGGRFELRKATIHGGGQDMAGNDYELRTLLGQPDVGTMSGGSFSIAGGFWAIPPSGESIFIDGFEGD